MSSGTWTYNYEANGHISSPDPITPGEQKTIISGPNNRVDTYEYFGWKNRENGEVWKVGLPISHDTKIDGTTIESVSYEWQIGSKVSDDVLRSAEWFNSFITDGGVWVPYKRKQTIWRDGLNYITEFSGYDNYGNPTRVDELGNASRATDRSYWYNLDKNIVVGKIDVSTVTGGGRQLFY